MHYINDPGYEVPKDKILAVPHAVGNPTYLKEVITPLKGVTKRSWFDPHAYYCLPLTVGNQYGFLINSLLDVEITWFGGAQDAIITHLNDDNKEKQTIKAGFGSGIITVQNRFALKTPPGINLMTIQPPNLFLPGCASLTGVIECDNIRRDFTFNFKITIPNITIRISKGDPLGAFIPIPRYFVDSFEIDDASNYFDEEIIGREIAESDALSRERNTVDLNKAHKSGRRYFRGVHTDESKYPDHQKKVR